ncbi:MAG TPA: hypothetical protein VJM46_05380 [Candidatus Saccharimonadales bacterium]|nr:hypothetical protein [Candidatus Saccharimonadales bacterium]
MKLRRPKFGWKSIATVALLVVASVSVEMIVHQKVADAWGQATSRQSQPYTALSFTHTGKLPTYAPAGTTKHITFRLSNYESATTSYHYRAHLSTGSVSTVLDEGELTLTAGESADKTLTFSLPQPNMDGTIIVQLVNRAEYITFGTKS